MVPVPEKYNVPNVLYVPVKPEDLDWMVYHLVLGEEASTKDALTGRTGCTPEEVDESVRRLVSYFLIDTDGEQFRALSVPDMFLRSQCKYDDDMPIVIENGVVKQKRPVQ